MAKKDDGALQIMELKTREVSFRVLGTTPLVFNRMSAHGIQELLFPAGKKTAADKKSSLKHDPLAEFRSSPYINSNQRDPALFHFPSGGVKGAIASAALDMPGATKTQIGRLVSITSPQISVFGVPTIMASVVRMADIKRTPDIRFRACLPEWALEVTVRFPENILTVQGIANLLSAAGMFVGLGDFRVEKGKGDFGQFKLVGEEDVDWKRIVKEQGRAPQVAALNAPLPFDEETKTMLGWFNDEAKKRGVVVPSSKVTFRGSVDDLKAA